MIRAVDGFDLCEYTQVALKYLGYDRGFDQGFITAGRDGFGNATEILNTGFGEVSYEKRLDQQPRWGFHLDVQFVGPVFPTVDWYVISGVDAMTGASVPFLTLRIIPSGAIQIRQVSTGTVIATTAPLTRNTWNTVEFQGDYATTAALELRINGATAATGTAGGGVIPSRFAFRWQAFGPPSILLDNYVLWDGQGDVNNTFSGRVRVTSLLPFTDVQTLWTPSTGATASSMVNDSFGRAVGSPDGDATYITPSTATDQLFNLETSPCYGRNLALAVNICARPTAGSPIITALAQPQQTIYALGDVAPVAVGQLNGNASAALRDYFTYQVLAQTNPQTGDVWIDSEISNGWWGIRALSGAPVRVSAVYVEKVTSLLNLPYTCGGGSYSFAGP